MNVRVGIGNVAKTNRELAITLNGEEIKVFLQDGFYWNAPICDYMHIHSYTEIHFVSNGEMTFSVNGDQITVNESTALVIPARVYHAFVSKTEEAVHTAFQIDLSADSPSINELDEGLIRYLFAEIKKTPPRDDHAAIASIITMLCTLLFSHAPVFPHDITDAGYLINDFFSQNYRSNVKLCDLAMLLHLSDRQAERLVKEQTGRSFRDELTATRMRMADQLLATTSMSLTDIAQYVGYCSYAGFWKARERYKKY